MIDRLDQRDLTRIGCARNFATKGTEKAALRVKFDALKADVKPSPDTAFEKMMDMIGVREG